MAMKGHLFQSFKHAARGIALAWGETPFKIMAIAGLLAALLCVVLPLSRKEAVAVIMVVGVVLVLEILNTVIEHLVDMVQPRIHEYARTIKDLMAGAVLIASLMAAVVGVYIFGPYLAGLLSR